MMPLIDVVFLLLTFFIFAMVVMVEFKSSGVSLVSVEGGSQAVTERVVVVELDDRGGVLIDGRPVADDEVDARLREVASRADVPPVIVAVQDVAGAVDRAPSLVRLLDRIGEAGLTDVRFPKLDTAPGVSP